MPIGVLELTDTALIFRVRPRIIEKLFGAQALNVGRGDTAVIFRVRRLVGMGLGIRPQGMPTWYFWSSAAGEALQALSSAGFKVAGEEPEPEKWR